LKGFEIFLPVGKSFFMGNEMMVGEDPCGEVNVGCRGMNRGTLRHGNSWGEGFLLTSVCLIVRKVGIVLLLDDALKQLS
jgi:hypothetical protein